MVGSSGLIWWFYKVVIRVFLVCGFLLLSCSFYLFLRVKMIVRVLVITVEFLRVRKVYIFVLRRFLGSFIIFYFIFYWFKFSKVEYDGGGW